MTNQEHAERRAARNAELIAARIGRPAVYAPGPIVSPWVQRATAATLPVKEYAR